MSQGNQHSTIHTMRSATALLFLFILLCSDRSCHSFQPLPLLSTTRSSIPSSSISSPSLTSNIRRYSSHVHYYADPSSSNIHDQSPPPPSFEQRMRQQLKRYQSKKRTNDQNLSSAPPASSSQTKTNRSNKLVPDIRTLNEYKEALDRAGEDDKMLAVLWYSPWCKACKAVMPGIRTLAKRHPNVQFIQVPTLEENTNLHQGLDVPSVPYLHLYSPNNPRLVEEKKMTRKRLSGFQKLLCDYERGSCSLEQMKGNDEDGHLVWSTSNPYLVSDRSAASTTNLPKPSFPEAAVGGVGATVA